MARNGCRHETGDVVMLWRSASLLLLSDKVWWCTCCGATRIDARGKRGKWKSPFVARMDDGSPRPAPARNLRHGRGKKRGGGR